MQVLYLGRTPCTKETLPEFREKCRVTRHSRVFRGLTSSQRTPGIWGVTLRMGTGFREFPQTPRGRGFSLLGFYSSVKYHVNVSVD